MKFYKDQPNVWCLNKNWKFIEQDICDLPKGRKHDDIYGYAKAGGAKGPAELCYDDSAWEDVILPHDWVTCHPFTLNAFPNQGYKKRGHGWYRLKFHLDETDKNQQILLEFEGLSSKAYIYINGTLVKRHFYGYNSFCLDISDYVNFGLSANLLAVQIQADTWEGWWYEGAGIYRNVWLIKKGPIHIASQGVYVKTTKLPDGYWKVELETTIENTFAKENNFMLQSCIFKEGIKIASLPEWGGTIKGFEHIVCKQETIIKQVHPWSLENPELYELRSDCGEDYLVTRFGFRTICMNAETGFWLNGENIKIKGMCNHQDHAGIGVAVPYAVKEYRLTLLKKLGANAYRCAHNPDPDISDICDRIGMLVMEENRIFSSDEANLNELKNIICRARNHPSVIFYSIFNEEPLQGTEKGARIARRMKGLIKKLDDTRPVLGAFNGGYMEENGAAPVMDVVGINYNPECYDAFHEKFPTIPLIGSETVSALMVRGEYKTDKKAHVMGCYDDEYAPWGNTHQDAWRWVNERPFVAGTFVWTGFDYRGEPTPFEWPSTASFFGVYDSCGFPKEACYLYQAFWKKEPIIHIAAPFANANIGGPIPVMIITNCQEAGLYVNGQELVRKKINLYEQLKLTIPYVQGEWEVIGYNNGKAETSQSIRTDGKAIKTQIECSKQFMQADGLDAVIINVMAVDCHNMIVPDADHLINFEITGGATLIGVGNGNPNSHEADISNQRKLFHGKAQAIIRNTSCEDVCVKIRAEGLKENTLLIPVKEVAHIPYMEPVNSFTIEGWKMYFKLLDEMPDISKKVLANDMNSFEPIEFHDRPQPKFTGKFLKYGLYQAVIPIKMQDKSPTLYFPDIRGQVWIYLNKELRAERITNTAGAMKIAISDCTGEHIQCSVVIRNKNTENNEAGICAPVMMF